MRKTSLLTTAVICLAQISNAQISKGATFLGGSLNFSSNKTENTVPNSNGTSENNSSGWSVLPQFGKAVGTNQVFGLFLNFSGNRNEQKTGTSSLVNENHAYGGGIFYRRYYQFAQRFYLFGDASLGVSFGEGKTSNNTGTVNYVANKSNSTTVNLALTPGLSFAASRKLFLEASLNNLFALAYASNEGKTYDSRGVLLQTSSTKSFGGNVNSNGFSSLSVGLRWILPSAK